MEQKNPHSAKLMVVFCVVIRSTKGRDHIGLSEQQKKLVLVIRQVCFNIAFVMVAATMLSACPSKHALRNVVDAPSPTPAAVSLAPLQYSWNTSYSAMLSPADGYPSTSA